MLATFTLTLAWYFLHEGLWRSDAASVTAPEAAVASRPFSPASAVKATPAAAAVAAASPPPAIVTPEPVQSEPDTTPEVDHAAMPDRRDRDAARGARSR